MGYKEARRELIDSRSALRFHSMGKSIREKWQNEGDGEYVSKKQKKAKMARPLPDTIEAEDERRVIRVMAAADNPRVVGVLKDIIVGDIDQLTRNRILFGES